MKILCHTQNQENHNLNVKSQSRDAKTRMNQDESELPDKDFLSNCFKDQLQLLLKQMKSQKIS